MQWGEPQFSTWLLLFFRLMPHKKLQKLCYYAYAWYLTLFGEPLFDERFQAWIHGPVEPSLYQQYKTYGWQSIPSYQGTVRLPESVRSFVRSVYDAYGSLSGDDLERLTHSEEPWKEARMGRPDWEPLTAPLDDETIRRFYERIKESNQSE